MILNQSCDLWGELRFWLSTPQYVCMEECKKWSVRRAGKVAAAETGLWETWSPCSQAQLGDHGPHRYLGRTLHFCRLVGRCTDLLCLMLSYFKSKMLEPNGAYEGHGLFFFPQMFSYPSSSVCYKHLSGLGTNRIHNKHLKTSRSSTSLFITVQHTSFSPVSLYVQV